MIDKLFKDSRFISTAWNQLLETQSPKTIIFFVDDKKITIKEVIDVLEGKTLNSEIENEISKFFQEVVSESMKTIRGRFSSGLGG